MPLPPSPTFGLTSGGFTTLLGSFLLKCFFNIRRKVETNYLQIKQRGQISRGDKQVKTNKQNTQQKIDKQLAMCREKNCNEEYAAAASKSKDEENDATCGEAIVRSE